MKFHLVFALMFLTSPLFAREVPSDWSFVTLKSPHFDVVVNAKQQDLGVYYLHKLEQSFSVLGGIFTDKPERTVVVIADNTDLTNGYATRIPYPHIVLYPVLPGPMESLGESGDWALELAAHELTHIFTFEAVSGAFDPMQSIFGTIMSPNLLLPRWWKEGVAVEVETRISTGGRARSAYQDGVLRTMENEDGLKNYDLAQINEALPDWPEGMRPYLFGSLVWSEAVSEKGVGVINELHQAHGGRVPFFVEEPARRHLGVNYLAFYAQTIEKVRKKLREQIQTLKTLPPSQSTLVLESYKYSWSPEISPDGNHMAAIAEDDTGERFVVFLERDETGTFRPSKEFRAPTLSGPIYRLSWLPTNHQLVFDKIERFSSHEQYSDLWLFDRADGRQTRLTFGLRAREPVASREGQRIYFVGLEGGRTWLGVFDILSKTYKRLVEFGPQERASWPTLTLDGRVVFSLRKPNGSETLHLLSEDETLATPVLADYPNARLASATEDGLLFTSSRNGVHNVYIADTALARARPQTHSLGSVFSSTTDVRTGDLYATTMTHRGPRIERIPAAERVRVADASSLPAVSSLLHERYLKDTLTVPTENTTYEVEPYKARSYLLPRYWLPLFAMSGVNNSVILQASTTGFDPLKEHVYALALEWDTAVKDPSFAATYQNSVWAHSILFSAHRMTSYLISPDNIVRTDSALIALVPDLFRVHRNLTGAVGWVVGRKGDTVNTTNKSGPTLSLTYSDFRRGGSQISPEKGGSLWFSATDYLPGGNQIEYTQYSFASNLFWSKWLPTRHAFAFRTSVLYTPDTVGALHGSQSTNYFAKQDAVDPNFVIRGYRVGHFFGKTLANGTLEYRFPLRELRRGHGTDPFYMLRLHGAVFADALATDGFAYRPKDSSKPWESTRTNRIFSSAGAEARLETVIGYSVPFNFIVGYVFPSHKDYSDGSGITLAFQLGTLF